MKTGSQLKKRTPLRAKTGFKRPLVPKQPKVRVPLKKKRSGQKSGKSSAPKLPSWVRAIPESQSHGTGTLQKRLWRVTSDFVRIRDWHAYGYCVATGRKIPHWTLGDAGHYKSWSKCNGLYKFNVRNIHLQSKQSNSWGDIDDWRTYEVEIKSRGYDPDEFSQLNTEALGNKISTAELLDKIQTVLRGMALLKEQPEYYARTMSLLGTQS